MKKKLFLSALVLLFCLSFSFAASQAEVSDVNQGHVVPTWYEEPERQERRNTTAFTGKGVSTSKRQAELLAYSDLCANISDFTGSGLGEIDYREISTKGTLKEYGLEIKKSYSTYNGATYAYYVLATASNEELALHRSAQVVDYYNKLAQIESSILEGDKCMTEGNYVGALRNYIDSMCVSYGMEGVQPDYTFDAIYSEVKSILDLMYFSVRNQSSSTGDIQMYLRIREGIIPFNVPDSEICLDYTLTDVKGEEYSEQYVLSTDSKGRFVFSPKSFGVTSGSLVTFSLNLGKVLDKLEKVNSEAAATLRALVDKNAYHYVYYKDYSMGSILIAGLDYMVNGTYYESHISTEYLANQFAKNGAVCSPLYVESDLSDAQIISKSMSDYRGFGCVLITRIAVTSSVTSSTGQVITSAEGNAILYRISDSAILSQTEVINANGFGKDWESSYTDAYKTISEIVYNLIRNDYV